MSVTIKYKAKMTWTDRKTLKYYEDVMCNVIHMVREEDDGTWKTIALDWEPIK